ncbi:hypothetical protein LY90DRAFT_700724 [Neocallimastix californiae]|uniref:AAA-ATPase-like domain-containing protein n=1 Tax=Neocallimastix californiae TaxID=1754190 RepID=A0A1Y2E1Y7_9FUNG|nr:hypothetical protein LY90DRAFT_700724 [Neocallimastix californiae]|eukprot:ORY65568.1 hypothetical protein LY90DRAFT_700724 [Neocallimastix californiae]
MGRIIDSDSMFINYQEILNQDYFVDKSNIINKFNKLIGKKGSKYVCITKPRRFGKTSIAAMLITYYSKGIDSKKIFDELKVSKGISSDNDENKVEIDQYNEFQKKYHTLYFDFSYGVNFHKTLKGYLKSINKRLKKDIEDLYPNSNILKNFAYMTGILPISKQLSQSTINCFTEYSMLNDKDYYQYFGFTEQEVKDLCEINKTKYNKNKSLKYNNIEEWYNGYKNYNGRFNEVVDSIDFKIHGVKNDILDLIKGNNIAIKLEKYGAEDLLKDTETNDSQKKNNKR